MFNNSYSLVTSSIFWLMPHQYKCLNKLPNSSIFKERQTQLGACCQLEKRYRLPIWAAHSTRCFSPCKAYFMFIYNKYEHFTKHAQISLKDASKHLKKPVKLEKPNGPFKVVKGLLCGCAAEDLRIEVHFKVIH